MRTTATAPAEADAPSKHADVPSGCLVFVPQDDEDENAGQLADTVAQLGQFFRHAGRPYWLRDGKFDEVSPNLLREIITTHIVVPRPVNRGNANEPYWVCSYEPYQPTEHDLRTLLAGAERPLRVQRARGNSLLSRIPKISGG